MDNQNDQQAPITAETIAQSMSEVDAALAQTTAVQTPQAEPAAPVAAPTQDAAAPAAEQPEQDDSYVPDFRLPLPPSTTVQLDAEVLQALPDGKKWDDQAVTLTLPSDRRDRIISVVRTMPKIDDKSSRSEQEWARTLEDGIRAVPLNDLFDNTVDREGAAFRQAVSSENGPLAARRPSFSDTEGVKLTGERALLRIRTVMGAGGHIQIPLWHSGFWITIKTPTDGELLELERRIAEEKVFLGSLTNGAVFSNVSVFIVQHLMQFILDHIQDTTLLSNENLLQKILSHDIQHAAWGLACSIWPNGFQYTRAVIGKTDAENHVAKAWLRLGKLQVTDTTELTDWQIAHMSKRASAQMTDESIKRYRDEFTVGQGRRVNIAPGIDLGLKVPTAAEYMDSGHRWINAIVQMTDQAFGLNQDQEERDQYILNQGRATFMRQYAHWVEKIYVADNEIDDLETVERSLSEMSTDDEARELYVKEINRFIEDSCISVIGVPTVDEAEENRLPRFPHWLPLDAMATFFILLGQKVQKIRLR